MTYKQHVWSWSFGRASAPKIIIIYFKYHFKNTKRTFSTSLFSHKFQWLMRNQSFDRLFGYTSKASKDLFGFNLILLPISCLQIPLSFYSLSYCSRHPARGPDGADVSDCVALYWSAGRRSFISGELLWLF